jgi:hypothetical protein
MDAEQLRAFLLKLPHVVETMQWGANLVFWVGDKAIGGKMFALMNLDEPQAGRKAHPVLSYVAGPARYAERWGVFTASEWRSELTAAHAITLDKLPPKMRAVLKLPAAEQRRLVAARRKTLGAKG